MTASIAVFGNLAIDDLVYADGTTRWAVPGGSAIYAGFGAALWAGHASIVAPIGADYPTEILDERFDLSRCSTLPRTLRNWGLYEDDGARHFVSRKATRNWREFSPKPEDASSGYQTAAHIGPLPHDVAIELSRELRKAGTRIISLDLDEHDLEGRVELEEMIELSSSSDLFLPSLQDALRLFPGTGVPNVLHRLREILPDVALIAVKCGAEGVIAHAAGANEWIHVAAVPVDAIDATGAGDAFCGGVLAGFVKEGGVMEALLAGTVSASFCVEGFGPAGLIAATKDEADARLSALRERIEVQPI